MLPVGLRDDGLAEGEETFLVRLTESRHATLADHRAEGRIVDDEEPPEVSVRDATGTEGGTVDFAVSLSGPSGLTVTVDYVAEDGTAVSGADYVATTDTLTFMSGTTVLTVSVALPDDALNESTENFRLRLLSVVNASFARDEATATVLDDDAPPTVSVGDDAGGEDVGELAFAVALDAASGREVTVAFATVDGTAMAGADYGMRQGVLTFAPSDRYATVAVEVVDDGLHESDETFAVELSAADGAVLDDAQGTGTIRDDDEPPPAMDVADSAGTEGGAAAFVVSLDKPSGQTVTVAFATSDGTAVADGDFEARDDVLTLAPQQMSGTISVTLVDDATDEPDETFTLTLSDPEHATINTGSATGTVRDNDDPPVVSVADTSGTEGGTARVRVALAGASSSEVAVAYATGDGTAVAGADYESAAGSLTFASGESALTVAIALVDDAVSEAEETFVVSLSMAENATLGTATAAVTVIDDDGAPRLSVEGGTDVEGGTVSFTVSVVGQRSQSVEVGYATSDGTAVADEDYEAAQGTLTFAVGDTGTTVAVDLHQDTVDEPDENFALTLSSPRNATLAVSSADGVIVDDDGPPSLSVADARGVEGGELSFPVALAGTASEAVTVAYATSDGTAVADEDYLAATGTLTFGPGESARTILVSLLDDGEHEPEETMAVTLSSPTRAVVGVGAATGRIVDDDAAPTLSVEAATGSEGGAAAFAVTLTGSTGRTVTVTYATADGTAHARVDYQRVRGVLTFVPGDTRRTVSVTLAQDALDESDETFTLALSSPVNAVLAIPVAQGTIVDDDAEPALSITGAADIEGGEIVFQVSLSAPSGRAVGVDYGTADGTATASRDYRRSEGRLTFARGNVSSVVRVALLDDAVDEPDETFAVVLSSPLNASLARASADGRIIDNDGAATLTVGDAVADEGAPVEFVVSLAGASDQSVTVVYRTVDGTALAGEDYESGSGTLTFTPGDSELTVSVSTLEDAVYEPEEQFRLELSSPANATLAVGAATGTIVDGNRAHKAPTKGRALLFESTTRAGRQGFVRIINHSSVAGELVVEGFDDSGMRVGPLGLSIGAGVARHFNSGDFESGNVDKGIAVGVGPPSVGAWRLEFSSELDLEVLSYARTPDGFVTSLHDTAPATAGVHRAVFLNPGGNVDQVSRLRLVNPGAEDARVTITGTDDAGGMSAEVVVALPAGVAREWTAAELESGAGTDGALGDGDGKWRLSVSSDRPVVAMSLIESPTQHLTNLSTLPSTPGRTAGSHVVPLFPSASDLDGRQGFVRVANRSEEAREVRIEAFDRSDWEYEPLALSVGAGEVASFNSNDLELGNSDKGLTGSTGAGDGDWWLELSSGGDDIGVWAYIRTADGFLTSMHDLIPEADGAHRVVFFNPAKNARQVSVLWLVNPGDGDARVTITGVDDLGETPGTAVRMTVPAGSSRRLTSVDLESGDAEAIEEGALGDGVGKWRLEVESDLPIRVMSLIENPTGHLTNLSTAPPRDAAVPEPASASSPRR